MPVSTGGGKRGKGKKKARRTGFPRQKEMKGIRDLAKQKNKRKKRRSKKKKNKRER